ncbi:MAG: polynucleotide kinase-phosphatase, partial [Planctomycetes bacterium]|nr:polynucleotide kinase-phosphatase [Planctomycetota bacterium]
QAGFAICVPGNHDMKLHRKLCGRDVQISHGLANTLSEIDGLSENVRGSFCDSLAEFLDKLVSHYVLDSGNLVVAHAGMKEEMQGRGSGKVRDFALYGETTGETDEFGLPVRHNWAVEYRGAAMVVYGHTPVPEPEWLNRTVNIDTGCVFGGKLTAIRYPEREFVSVPAKQTYCQSARPFLPVADLAPVLTAQQQHDDVLDVADVTGKRIISTRLHHTVTVREENATAALEVMSRFAANPKWLIYLPPTMSPCETSNRPEMLEHPEDAFTYFRSQGVPHVICEEKHMGSRAVVVVCRDENIARERFGVTEDEFGIVVTRTGRRFFNESDLEVLFLDRIRSALTASNFWDEFETGWVCLDCELMPWSAKAQELLKSQYAAVGSAGRAALPQVVSALQAAEGRMTGEEQRQLADLGIRFRSIESHVNQFVTSYRRYCWSVNSLEDLKLAPFHLLATEGKVHTHQNHVWHMQTLAKVCQKDSRLLRATPFKIVNLTDVASEQDGIAWWEELTNRGGEGMVVKPLEFVIRGKKGLVQPAVKCRGREYLRIIYGPDYTSHEHLSRLRKRG